MAEKSNFEKVGEKKEEPKTIVKKETIVLTNLPQQQIRSIEDEGKHYDILTIEEAITEILQRVRRIEKGVVGTKE